MSSERKLCFMTWNSNGLKEKREEKKHQMEKQECDVVFLQQTRSCESEVLEVLDGYKSFYTTQTSKSTGVAILIKTNILEETECTIDEDIDSGCYILVKCTLNGQLFTLVSVYNYHNNMRPLLRLTSVLEKHAEGILLIGGDFNVALNPYLDRTSRTKNSDHFHFRPVVEKLMTSFHLVDVWRRLHPKTRQYSYKQTSDNEIRSRLDYIFVPEESMQYIEMCDISPCTFPDHHPVVLKMCMFNKESKKLEVYLDIIEQETRMHIIILQEKVVNKWLSCKREYWPNLDLTVNPHKPLMISAREVAKAIQSLIVTKVERPDGIPVSFYKTYSYVLIPHLCAFFNKILEEPTNIPEAFIMRNKVSKPHYIFNVDYLILASIMASWLYEHLQSHSADYTDDNTTKDTVLFSMKGPINVLWSFLKDLLDKEQDKHRTEPPLHDKFKICALHKILKNWLETEYKSLHFGCPLTPVLMTLCLKHAANKMVENLQNHTTSIHISRENVIVTFSKKCDLLESFKEKFNTVEFTILKPDLSN